MTDKKLMFLAINMLITVFSLAIIIGTMFIENQSVKNKAYINLITTDLNTGNMSANF